MCSERWLDNVAVNVDTPGEMARSHTHHGESLLSLAQAAARCGVRRQELGEWVRLGLVPMPLRLGERRNGRVVAYGFREADLPGLCDLVAHLKKGVVRR